MTEIRNKEIDSKDATGSDELKQLKNSSNLSN